MGRARLPVGGHGRIHVERLASGVWRARTRVRDPDRLRQVEAVGRSQKSAERALTRRLAQRESPTPVKRADITSPAERDLRWWVAAYLEQALVRPQTVGSYRRALVAVPTRLWTMRVPDLTPLDMASIARGHRPANERLSLIVMRQALDRAVLARVITSNPARSVPPRPARKPPAVRALTEEEEVKLLQLIRSWEETRGKHGGDNHRLHDVVVVGLALGARIGETLALTTADIDILDDTRVRTHVRATVVDIKGGAKRQEVPKTAAGNRSLVINGEAAAILRRRAERAPNARAYLFPSRAGGISTPANVRRALRSAVKNTELAWVTPHSLRRTRGTRIAQARGVLTAAEALGHANTRTISRYVQQRREVDLTDEA